MITHLMPLFLIVFVSILICLWNPICLFMHVHALFSVAGG